MKEKFQIDNRSYLKTKRKNLRNNATQEEKILWQFLKGSQLGFKFRRQHSIYNYILDFYCPKLRLAIELDGAHHYSAEGKKKDEKRDDNLRKLNIRVLRFPNSEVREDIETVLGIIKKNLTTPIFPSFMGGGIKGRSNT